MHSLIGRKMAVYMGKSLEQGGTFHSENWNTHGEQASQNPPVACSLPHNKHSQPLNLSAI